MMTALSDNLSTTLKFSTVAGGEGEKEGESDHTHPSFNKTTPSLHNQGNYKAQISFINTHDDTSMTIYCILHCILIVFRHGFLTFSTLDWMDGWMDGWRKGLTFPVVAVGGVPKVLADLVASDTFDSDGGLEGV